MHPSKTLRKQMLSRVFLALRFLYLNFEHTDKCMSVSRNLTENISLIPVRQRLRTPKTAKN